MPTSIRRRRSPAIALLFFVQLADSSLAGGVDDCGDAPFFDPCLISEEQIAVKTFIPGNIEEPGDVDVFSFEVQSSHLGFLYVLETLIPGGDPFSDTYLRLIDRDGFSEIASDNDSGVGAGSKILWAPEIAGTYFVEVSQFLPGEIGLYQISVFRSGPAPPDDHGNSPQTATLLTVNGPPASASTELTGDVDYFKFAIQPNGFYDIETSGLGPGSDTVITLFGSDGSSVIALDDQGGRQFNSSRILWISPPDASSQGGFAFVRIQQFLPGASGVGCFIEVRSPGPPRSLSTDGEPTGGSIPAAGEVDAYVFGATQNSILEVELEAPIGELNLFEIRLIDSDGASVLASENKLEFENLVYFIDRTDLYYLLATEPFEGGAYLLTARLEAAVGDPDLNLDGRIDHKDFLILMEAYSAQGEEP